MSKIDEVPSLVKRLWKVVAKLETLFPGRRFTLDGHLVGSIGEVIAAHRYELELLRASEKDHDAKRADQGDADPSRWPARWTLASTGHG